MPHTLAILMPIVALLAGPTGAGLVASILFNRLRCWFPLPTTAPASALVCAAYRLLHTPRYARFSVLLLAGFIAAIFSMLQAALVGGDIAAAADVALSVALAAIVSQVRHAFSLSTEVKP